MIGDGEGWLATLTGVLATRSLSTEAATKAIAVFVEKCSARFTWPGCDGD